MDEQLREYGLAKPGAWADSPWGEDHDVAKVGPGGRGKIFAFFGGGTLAVTCGSSRDEADEWLDRHPDDATVIPRESFTRQGSPRRRAHGRRRAP